MAAQLNIAIRRNEVWGRAFQVCDGDGNPYDITGSSLAGQVKSRTDNTTVVATFTCTITDAVNGFYKVVLDATEGTALNAYGQPIQTENLPYDIRLTDKNGVKIDLVYGVVILDRGVTQSV